MSARTRASTGAGPGRPGRRVMEWSERSTLLPALKIGERGSTRQKWQGVALDAIQGGRGSRRMKKEVDVGRNGRRPDKRVGRIPRGALTCRRRGARREGVPGSGAPTGQDAGLRRDGLQRTRPVLLTDLRTRRRRKPPLGEENRALPRSESEASRQPGRGRSCSRGSHPHRGDAAGSRARVYRVSRPAPGRCVFFLPTK